MSKLPDGFVYITRTTLRTKTDWQEEEEGPVCPYPGAMMTEITTEFGASMWYIIREYFTNGFTLLSNGGPYELEATAREAGEKRASELRNLDHIIGG